MSQAHERWVRVCEELNVARVEENWKLLVEWSSPNTSWHSLDNCITYQTRVWSNMLSEGVEPVARPRLFEVALLMRHLPPDKIALMLADVSPKTTDEERRREYLTGLLIEDDTRPAPTTESDRTLFSELYERDVQIFEDLELAVLGAPRDAYLRHAALVRAEYPDLHYNNYLELRLKVLERLSLIPKLYRTNEFSAMEALARGNIAHEITNIRDQLHMK